MKEQKIIKFNLYMSAILLAVFVLMLVCATIAYFTDTKQVSNTFTAGNVKIELSEAAVKKDTTGNLIEDANKDRILGGVEETVNNYGKIYPGQSIFKDPTVKNTGDNPEWIAVKVTLADGAGDLTKIMGYEGYEDIDIEVLLTGGLLDETVHFGRWNGIEDVCYNDNYAMIQVPNAREGRFEFFFLMLKPLEIGDSVTVFDHIVFPREWNNKEMEEMRNLKIKIEAFGVQMYQLESCLAAMTESFPTQFIFN